MNSQKELLALRVTFIISLLVCFFMYCLGQDKRVELYGKGRMRAPAAKLSQYQQRMCVPMDDTVRAKSKSCLLRPDTGPCRADIIAWYYDARLKRCFRFFWGGCQGNGNKFSSHTECLENCYLNVSMDTGHIPYFCQLTFDYGTCYGEYRRWTWDHVTEDCRLRIYSGCGGNQNNFETKHECMATCLNKPNNTMGRFQMYTTCIPYTVGDLQRK